MRRTAIVVAILFGLILGSAGPAGAQITYDPNREDYVLLALNQAYIQLGQSARSFLRVKEQFNTGLVSAEEYERSVTNFQSAKINYDQALMRILSNASYVIVTRAVKRVMDDGRKIVSITVRNEAGGSFELTRLATFGARETQLTGDSGAGTANPGLDGEPPGEQDARAEGSLSEEVTSYEPFIADALPYVEGQGLTFSDLINMLEINNIFVSLSARSEANELVMISDPYESRINRLRQGEEATLEFGLLRDVESCTININYGDTQLQKPVYLRLESTAGGVEMTSENPNLQADLDGTATYNISLQLFSRESTNFALRVAGLPEQIDYNFIDPENNNQQITTVNFTEGRVRKSVQLQLTMPTRASERVLVDQSISFAALVLNPSEARAFDLLAREHGRYIPQEELAELHAGTAELTITPLGVGRIEVSASTFYYPIQPDERVEMTINVRNTGTGTLRNVAVDADLPNNEWTAEIEPDLIRELEPEQEQRVRLIFAPPPEATVGEHILKVKVEARTRNRVIEADDKEVTVEIKERPDIWGRLILIVLLIGIVLGIVIFGIKLSRR